MTFSSRASASCSLTAALALLAAGLSVTGGADEVHYDVFVTGTGPGTKLVIGGYEDENSTAVLPAGQLRVFGGEVVGENPSSPYQSENPGEPGFRAVPQEFLNNGSLMTPAGVYTALPGTTNLTFNFQPITIGAASRNLFFWDGEGAVAFSPAAADVVLGLTKQGAGGWTASINGSSSGVIAGNTIQETRGTGSVHTHLFTSISKAGAAPDQGFYLFSLELGMADFTPSDPLYFVYGALDPTALSPTELLEFEEAHETALGWVEASVVPEPSTLALTALAAAAAVPLARRLRRH
jgi:hypothetical protein